MADRPADDAAQERQPCHCNAPHVEGCDENCRCDPGHQYHPRVTKEYRRMLAQEAPTPTPEWVADLAREILQHIYAHTNRQLFTHEEWQAIIRKHAAAFDAQAGRLREEARAQAFREAKEDCRLSHTVEVQRINALQAKVAAAEEENVRLDGNATVAREEIERLRLERDQQERFKWEANKRADAAESRLREAEERAAKAEAEMRCQDCSEYRLALAHEGDVLRAQVARLEGALQACRLTLMERWTIKSDRRQAILKAEAALAPTRER